MTAAAITARPAPAAARRYARAAVLAVACGGAIAGALWTGAHVIWLSLVAAVITALAVAALVARVRWRADASRPGHRMPPVMSRAGLIAASDPVVERCRAKQQPLSLAVIELAELAEVCDLFGRRVAEAVIARLHTKLQSMAGPRGLVARTGAGRFALLLPGHEAGAALAALRTGFGPTGSLEHDGEHELVLLPAFEVDLVGSDQRAIGAVHDELCRAVSAMVQPIAVAKPGTRSAPHASRYLPTTPLPLRVR